MFRPFGGGPTGTPTAFGVPQQNPGFGASSTFGAPSTAPSGAFGGQQPTSFGQTSSGFGAGTNPRYSVTNDNENNTNIALQSITAMPAYQRYSFEELRLEDYLAGRKGSVPAPFGAIGGPVPSQQPSTGLFGSNAGQSSAFGAGQSSFGSTQPQAAGGIFGGQPAVSNAPSSGLFGSNPTSTSFGQTSAVPTPASTFGTFGQPAQPSGGLFGTSQQSTLTTTGGLFGSSQPGASATSTFGNFGKPAAPTTTSSFGTFGQPTSAPSTGLFGSTQPSIPGPSSGGIFGSNVSTFGTPSTANLTGTFGKPSTGPFGTSTTTGSTGTGLFGQPAVPSTASQPSGGLFGTLAQPAQPQSGTGGFSFGATATQTQPATAGGFSFGAQPAANQPSNAPSFPALGNLNFPSSTTPIGTAAAGTGQSGLGFSFGAGTGAPAMSSIPSLNLGGTAAQPANAAPATSGLSFGLGQNATQPTGFSFGTNTSVALQANPALPIVNPEALSIKPPIPAGLLTPKEIPLLDSSGKPVRNNTLRSPARFVPRTSFRLQPPPEVPLPGTRSITGAGVVLPRTTKGFVKKLTVANVPEAARFHLRQSCLRTPGPDVDGEDQLEYGDKFMIPNDATLRKLPYTQLSCVQNFTVGEKGVGQIRFLQAVDLTKITINEIFDKIVIFEPRQVTVYPEDEYDEGTKPAVGSELNVPAEIRLEKCWPMSKSTREPIKDMGDERVRAHIERLKNQDGTQFVDFLPETGTWIFRVEHFSTYGVDAGDDAEAVKSLARGHSPLSAKTADSQLEAEWETRGLQFAKRSLNYGGNLFRMPLCWISDGSGVVFRFGLTRLYTFLTPKTAAGESTARTPFADLIVTLQAEDREGFARFLVDYYLCNRGTDFFTALLYQDISSIRTHFVHNNQLLATLDRLESAPEWMNSAIRPLLALQLHQIFLTTDANRNEEWRKEALVLALFGDSLQHIALLGLPLLISFSLCLVYSKLSPETLWSMLATEQVKLSQDEVVIYHLLDHFLGKKENIPLLLESVYSVTRDWNAAWEIYCKITGDAMHETAASSKYKYLHCCILRNLIWQNVEEGEWIKAISNGFRHLDFVVRTDQELENLSVLDRQAYYGILEGIKCVTSPEQLAIALAQRNGIYGDPMKKIDLLLEQGLVPDTLPLIEEQISILLVSRKHNELSKFLSRITTFINMEEASPFVVLTSLAVSGERFDGDGQSFLDRWNPDSKTGKYAKVLLMEMLNRNLWLKMANE